MKIVLASLLTIHAIAMTQLPSWKPLEPAPTTTKSYGELLVRYQSDIVNYYNELSPEERTLCYYLYRASLPCNRILADQHHRHAVELISLFEQLYNHKEHLEPVFGTSFVQDVEQYLVYLWVNQGPYFKKEYTHNKRTPQKLGLLTLTCQSLTHACKKVGIDLAPENSSELFKLIFAEDYEPTLTVSGSIQDSAVNIYGSTVSDELYRQLSLEDKNKLNASYKLNDLGQIQLQTYSSRDLYKQELSVALYWLEKAYAHAQRHPHYFDESLVESLQDLLLFLQTGEEAHFKQHCQAWLKSKSRIDYTFGFIETYLDPMGTTGAIQAECTIKTFSFDSLARLLPTLEQQLPIPHEYKRERMDILPNASLNLQLFGAGDLGPLCHTRAYCLPNYEDLRSQHGSKQIMYADMPSLGELINPRQARRLSYLSEQVSWLEQDNQFEQLPKILDNILCILHETIGHASGRLATHVFTTNDPLVIDGVSYKSGDTLALTPENLTEFLGSYEGALEELRAEIIALYISINHIQELWDQNLLPAWTRSIEKQDLITWFIITMARQGIMRLVSQSPIATEIAGAHAQADSTIMHYLLKGEALELVLEPKMFTDKEFIVPGLRIKNLSKAQDLVKELMQEVQRIKSTGDYHGVRNLLHTYGIPLNRQVRDLVRQNQQALVGDLKGVALIYPQLEPIYNSQTAEIVDVQASWPADILSQHLAYRGKAVSCL
jgi:dipeptidyl-peptidase-3